MRGPDALREEVATAFVGVGANLGDTLCTAQAALSELSRFAGIDAVRVSPWYRSAPVDAVGPDFVNAVAEVRTRLTAPALLTILQGLEDAAGRQRPYRNAPRTLDLDLLCFGGAQISSTRLSIPHPRMWGRAFVLRPLRDLAPQWVSDAQLAAVASQGVWPLAGEANAGRLQMT